MSNTYAIVSALLICFAAAVLEGLCAGKNVRAFFLTVRIPKYSAPLWAWSIIGVLYYAIFGFVLYRLFRVGAGDALVRSGITLVVVMMALNALTNYVIFRARDLRRSFLIGVFFPVLDVALFVILLQIDSPAALSLIPYLVYRIYGVYWGYALWKANPRA